MDIQHEYYHFLRNCKKETESPVEGKSQGQLPAWLQGELIQVGPGIRKVGNDEYKHIFDGLGIIHKFTIKNGKAFYQSRFLNSDAFQKCMNSNRIVVSEFGTFSQPDPCQGLFGRLKTEFKAFVSICKTGDSKEKPITDNCCVNVNYVGDQLYAMTETNLIRRINPFNLETVGDKINISGYIAINTATAHPHTLKDGAIINAGNNFRHSRGPHYCFVKVPPNRNSKETAFANAKLIGEIPSRWKFRSAYFHSFGITKTEKLIFVEAPYCINLVGVVCGGILQKSYNDWTNWHRKEKTRFYVMSMRDGKLHPIIYETERLFLFHHINAYEENEELVVDVAGYSDAEWISQLTIDNLVETCKFSEQPAARRFILPLNVKSAKRGENLVKAKTNATAILRSRSKNIVDVTPQFLSQGILELPCINYNYNGRKYNYFYGLGEKKFGMDVIYKINPNTGEKLCWTSNEPVRASEPIFVPDPTKLNPAEDDGVILTILLPFNKLKSIILLVLDARNLHEVGRIEFLAEGDVTASLHGQWKQSD